MSKPLHLKLLGIAVLTVGLTVGCATQQQQKEPEPAAAPAPEAAGPSEAQQAIQDAEAAIAKAKSLAWVWRDTEKILKKAKKAAKEGKDDQAVKLANEAKMQAELAVEQYYREQDMDRSVPPLEGMSSYTVVRGDNLWSISAKPEVYADPYQWPLIYKANSGKITDADLIYPGQEFDIDTAPSDDEVDAAVRHAKTRGAWSLGVVEESDQAYLRGSP